MRAILVSIIAFSVSGIAFAQVTSQSDLAARLSFGDPAVRRESAMQLKSIPVAIREPIVLEALVGELARIEQELGERRIALDEGRQPPSVGEEAGEYLFALLDVVADYNDPRALKSMLPFIGTGVRVMNAVATFGESAVPDLVAMARSVDPRDDPTAAVEVLRRIVVLGNAEAPLSPQSTTAIVTLSQDLLRDSSSVAKLEAALHLAAATRDPALTTLVTEFASGIAAASRLGITDDRSKNSLRLAAQRALAAVAAP